MVLEQEVVNGGGLVYRFRVQFDPNVGEIRPALRYLKIAPVRWAVCVEAVDKVFDLASKLVREDDVERSDSLSDYPQVRGFC